MIKKMTSMVMAMVISSICLLCFSSVVMAVEIRINDKLLVGDFETIIESGRVLIPFSSLFEALGASADYDGNTGSITGYLGEKPMVSFTIGILEPCMDVPAKRINERIYVPLRYVAEKLGAEVSYIEDVVHVTIYQERNDVNQLPSESGFLFTIGTESAIIFDNIDDLGIFVEIVEGTLSSKGADFLIRNSGALYGMFGEDYSLEMNIDGKWHDIQKPLYDIVAVGYNLYPGTERVIPQNWGGYQEDFELPKGHYRYVKAINVRPTRDPDQRNREVIYVNCEFFVGEKE